ncbi:MAG: GtrA family protein [Ruthenibacterium sp.]
MQKIQNLIKQYKAIILYVFFGGLTTLVNWIVYFALTRANIATLVVSNVIAWAVSVVFAYITNKRYVFESKTSGSAELCKELISFVASRVFSGILDTALMVIFVDIFFVPDMLAKVIVGIVIVIANFVLSKLFVFRDKEGGIKHE